MFTWNFEPHWRLELKLNPSFKNYVLTTVKRKKNLIALKRIDWDYYKYCWILIMFRKMPIDPTVIINTPSTTNSAETSGIFIWFIWLEAAAPERDWNTNNWDLQLQLISNKVKIFELIKLKLLIITNHFFADKERHSLSN